MKIHELSARAILKSLQQGELSSEEVVKGLHARADEVDGKLTGFVYQFREQVLVDARKADQARAKGDAQGPLHGLPISVKENIDTEGTPTTLGVESKLTRPAKKDAVVVRLSKEAGAIVLGKTNVPQTLLSPMESTNPIWGSSKNPWAKTHGSGGSSGGEAVVLASGQSPLGIGSDIGGSVRIPSGFCGTVGLKPTTPRWSNAGVGTALGGQEVVAAQCGPMARTTEDVALYMQALDPVRQAQLDPRVPPIPLGLENFGPGVELSGVRVGYYEEDGFFGPTEPCRRAVREAVAYLKDAGATMVEFTPDYAREMTYLMIAVMSSDGGRTLDELLEGETVIDSLKLMRRVAHLPRVARMGMARAARMMGEERLSTLLSNLGEKPIDQLWKMTTRRNQLMLDEQTHWQKLGLDAVVCPLLATPAAPLGEANDFSIAFSYAVRANVLNRPAGVIPVTRVREQEANAANPRQGDRFERRAQAILGRATGLPVGVQVIGYPWQENRVLTVMQAIEERARASKEFPATPVEF